MVRGEASGWMDAELMGTHAEDGRDAFGEAGPVFCVVAFGPFEQGGLAA